MDTKESNDTYDLIIIGYGVAGLSASVYAGRYRMKTLLIGEKFGGETATAGKIENYPSHKSIDGFDLANLIKEQAEALGVELVNSKADTIERTGHCFKVLADGKPYSANGIILAVGVERRKLNLPNEAELSGKGVHYCVTCDGPIYTGKKIAIVGGGDASVKGANLAAEYADKVFLIVRGGEIIAEPINYEQMKKLSPKIEVLLNTEVKEIAGKDKLEKLVLSKPYNGSAELEIDGLFVEIGAVPNVDLAKSLGVELDERGYIKTDNMMQTNIDGVFAAGDTVNHFGRFKQAITAAAMGAVAATSAYEDNKIHGDLCEYHGRPAAHK